MNVRRPDERNLESMAAVFDALGSPTRLGLLLRLVERSYPVNDLAAAAGAKQANVSQQLGILKRVGLVRSLRNGTTVTYSTYGPDVDRIIDLAFQILRGVVRRRYTSLDQV